VKWRQRQRRRQRRKSASAGWRLALAQSHAAFSAWRHDSIGVAAQAACNGIMPKLSANGSYQQQLKWLIINIIMAS